MKPQFSPISFAFFQSIAGAVNAMAEGVAGKSLELPWRRLDGKVVMVTGASAGLGREICLTLARAGCNIVAAARRTDRLRSLFDEINGMGSSDSQLPAVRSAVVELDASAKGSIIEASVQKAWDAFGRIDALVNNAGIRGGVDSPIDLTEEEWDRVIATNLTGAFLVSKYVCTRMRDAKLDGSVINISSISGLNRGQAPGALVYSTSKAGVNTMTKNMAMELGEYNIRVNAIAPGIFKSEITKDLMQKKWLKTVVSKGIPLRTLIASNPALTSLVQYLIHDSSEYVSGNIFIVDAGNTLPGIPIYSAL